MEDYRRHYAPLVEAELAFHAQQPSFELALAAVASWKGSEGMTYSHQSRVPASAKAEAGRRIRALQARGLSSFEELHDRVDEVIGEIPGIGDLAVYDVSLRIGAFLGWTPARIYLHRGTRTGARALGLDHRRPWLLPEDLPAGFRHLEPVDAENVLCIYKEVLGALAHPRTRRAA